MKSTQPSLKSAQSHFQKLLKLQRQFAELRRIQEQAEIRKYERVKREQWK